MRIRYVVFEDSPLIELSNFAPNINDQIPLGDSIYTNCDEVVDIFKDRNHYTAQIVLTDAPAYKLLNGMDGFSDDLLECKITMKKNHFVTKWDKTDSNSKPQKVYNQIIRAGKGALVKYLHSPYNHMKSHYKKVPEIKSNYNDDFVNIHKLA